MVIFIQLASVAAAFVSCGFHRAACLGSHLLRSILRFNEIRSYASFTLSRVVVLTCSRVEVLRGLESWTRALSGLVLASFGVLYPECERY